MQPVDRGAGVRVFRMDDRRQRLVIDRSLPKGQRYWAAVSSMANRVTPEA